METNIARIGKYKIVGILGKGAMGMVYQGYDPMIRRHVAIKTMVVSDDNQALEQVKVRFQREAQAAGNLSHANIVGIYEYGDEAGMAYIVMEYVPGETLAARMKRNEPLKIDETLDITRQVLSALEHAHAMGVVHRDIKPSNIMLTPHGRVKVADFGIARLETSNLTQAGTIMGTPGYMSPEQLKGEPVDHRTDLFSVGVILYEMLTGQKAFGGSTMASVIYKVVHEELPSPSRIQSGVPAGLDKVVAAAVAKNREDRFDSAAAFAAGLSEPDSATPAAAAGPVPDFEPPRQRLGLWAAAAFLVAVLAGAAVWYLTGTPSPSKPAVPEYQSGQIFADCDTCPSMVVQPVGPTVQASAGVGSPAGPERRLLAVGRFEVTRSQYARFAADTSRADSGCATYDGRWEQRSRSSWRAPGYPQTGDHPAVCVSWEDARAYTTWLSAKTGRTYRLLNAEEWAYLATRTDGGQAFTDDPAKACSLGNVADETAAGRYPGWQVFACRDNYVHTAPVGSFQPNGLGIYDLSGNIFEWVTDCWGETGSSSHQGTPSGAVNQCSEHELRGGSWFSRPRYVAADFKNHAAADYRSSSFGFRVAGELKSEK